MDRASTLFATLTLVSLLTASADARAEPPGPPSFSALTVSARYPRHTVMPIRRGGGTLPRGVFTYSQREGGCGQHPHADLAFINGGDATHPRLSRDGTRILYQTRRELHVLTSATGNTPLVRTVLVRGEHEAPVCILGIAADSSAVLYFKNGRRTAEDPVAYEGTFEMYSFAGGTTRTFTLSETAFVEDLAVVDDHTLIVAERHGEERRTLSRLDLVTGARRVLAESRGDANSFGQLTYEGGYAVYLGRDTVHLTYAQDGAAPRVWAAHPGRWAEFQWHRLSPSGLVLARQHQTRPDESGHVQFALELIRHGESAPSLTVPDVVRFSFESDSAALVAYQDVYARRQEPLEIARVDLGSGVRTRIATVRGHVVFAD